MKKKSLSEMTLEELWHLFPIRLVEHRPDWAGQFAEESDYLSALLSKKKIVSINHIGSTAIDGIQAKPIVDILIEMDESEDMKSVSDILVSSGYILMSNRGRRISLNKGYTPDGFADKVFHIHLRYEGDNAETAFRDYMQTHPEDAKKYEALKLSLREQYEFDRDGYTEAKTDFIQDILSRIK